MKFTLIALALAMILTSVYVQAHHSYSAFATDRLVTIEGDLEEIQYINAHSILKLKTKDAEVYTVEWQPANSLRHVCHAENRRSLDRRRESYERSIREDNLSGHTTQPAIGRMELAAAIT